MGDGIKTLGELAKEQETVDYWKERLAESDQTNAQLRNEILGLKRAVSGEQLKKCDLQRRLEASEVCVRALAKAVERLSEL